MRKLMMLLVATMSVVSVAQTQKSLVKPATTEVSFDPDLIEGTLSQPEGEYFKAGCHAAHKSLIKVPLEFRDKVMESARDL